MSYPKRCKAIVYAAKGGSDVIELRDIDTPTPGPDECLIEVAAAGLNRPDILQREGLYTPSPGNELRPGLEVAGTIVALGKNVTGVKLGDAVTALVNGAGYAEFAVAPAGQVLPVPSGWSFVEAASLPETFFTIQQTLIDRAGLAPGMTVLVHGASGGLGGAAIQIASALDARVIATVSSQEKAKYALSLGADHLCVHNREDFAERTLELTQGRGVDRIVDIVGGPALAQNIKASAQGGVIVLLAFLGGARAEISVAPLLMKSLTVFGSLLGSRSAAEKTEIATHLRRQVWPLIEAGRIAPQRIRTFPLAEAAAAQDAMDATDHFGKIVLVTAFGAAATRSSS